MEKGNIYRGLHFERPTRIRFPRLIAMGLGVIFFSITWLCVPHNVLFWLLLLPVCGSIWVASYGWRQALTILLAWLHRLEQL